MLINSYNIKYNLLEKKNNYISFIINNYYNKIINNIICSQILNSTFCLLKLYKNKNKYFKLKHQNLNKLFLINKLFESRYLTLNITLYPYKIINLLKYNRIIINYLNIFISVILNISLNNILIFYNYTTNLNTHAKSLILYPLIFNDSLNVNNYIYYIYNFIYLKTFNFYKSSLISLFYYFISLFLALFSLYLYNNIKILYSNLIIIATKLSSFIVILNIYKHFSMPTNIFSIKIINIINISLHLSNLLAYMYRPFLIGLTNYTLINTGILSKLSFQNTLKILQNIILKEKIEWKVDVKSNLITSDFISIGSGWYRYFINY